MTGIARSMCFARFKADGSLDDTFDGPNASPGNGKFTFLVNAISNEVKALVIQPDQKIVALGTCDNDSCLVRLNPDGSFDAEFVGPDLSGAGRFRINFGGGDHTAGAMALQSDGKIVAVGSCEIVVSSELRNRFCATRLLVDGRLDATFSGPAGAYPGDGRYVLSQIGNVATASEYARAVAIQSDDRIILAGQCPGIGGRDACLVRLNSSGTFDTSFDGPSGSGNGKVLVNFVSNGSEDGAKAIAIEPNGGILVAVECGLIEYDVCVARFTLSGQLDSGFGPQAVAGEGGRGYVSYSVAGVSFHFTEAITVQNDGKILVGANCNGVFCVLRLLSDGSPDTAFDGSLATPADGLLKFSFGSGGTRATSMALQPDGKIILAGYCDNGTNDDFCVARLNGGSSSGRNCSLDIDGDGKVTATIDSLIHARIALGLTGNAVIGGITFPANAKRNVWSGSGDNSIRKYLVTQCGMALP